MVKWSGPVREDLRHIHNFIALDSQYYAKKVVEEILDKSITLKDSLLRGRIVPEVDNNDVREVFVYSYRLIYEVVGDLIYVLAAIHGKRDIASINFKDYRSGQSTERIRQITSGLHVRFRRALGATP